MEDTAQLITSTLPRDRAALLEKISVSLDRSVEQNLVAAHNTFINIIDALSGPMGRAEV